MLDQTRKRIAIYTSSFPPKNGGIASAHYNLYLALARCHDVKAFVFDDKDGAEDDQAVRGRPFPGQVASFRLGLRCLLKRGLCKAALPCCDVIAEVAAAVVSMNRALGRFDPDFIICPDYSVPALLLRKPKGSKLIWMARHNYLRFTQQPLVPPGSWNDLLLAHRLERRAVRKADAVISPSEYMLGVFKAAFDHRPPMWVAKNFVDEAQLAGISPSRLRQILQVDADTPIVHIPSGGSEVKGARYVYEIVRRVSNVKPIGVYISGYVSSELRSELASLDTAACFLPGHVPYDENVAHVAACNLTVSPTLVENLSNALVESILLGVPVVTFDTGGNREVVRDDETGFVVPYADIEALVGETSRLIGSPDELRRLQCHCNPCARRIIDVSAVQGTYADVFRTLTDNTSHTLSDSCSAKEMSGAARRDP